MNSVDAAGQERSCHLRLAVLISGGGTTLRNLLTVIDRGELSAQVVLVISSTRAASGLRFAEEGQIASQVIRRTAEMTDEAYSEVVFQPCREAGADLVVMGGFLKHVLIPKDFDGRVMNIHPSLIPSFCGHGFYGHHVHEGVLNYGVKVSGCTVHFVDNQFDHGPIVLQETVPVHEDDTPETLAARVFEQECVAYPKAIQWFAEGRLTIHGRHVSCRRA